MGEPSAEQPVDERDGQRDERANLPPKQRVARWPVAEREDGLRDRAEGECQRSEQERGEHPSAARRCDHESLDHQSNEDHRENAVEDDHECVLQPERYLMVRADEQKVVTL